MAELKEMFDKHDEEFLKFKRIENKLHPRPDLCAFLLLDKLSPNEGKKMVYAAEHDMIFIDVDLELLAVVASEDDIVTLIRCGVLLDRETNSLAMFV